MNTLSNEFKLRLDNIYLYRMNYINNYLLIFINREF